MSNEKDKQLLEAILEDSRSGKVSRRQFLQHSIAAGLALTAGSAIWTSEVSAATPKRGGTFRVGVHDANTSDTLDPATFSMCRTNSDCSHTPQLPNRNHFRKSTRP